MVRFVGSLAGFLTCVHICLPLGRRMTLQGDLHLLTAVARHVCLMVIPGRRWNGVGGLGEDFLTGLGAFLGLDFLTAFWGGRLLCGGGFRFLAKVADGINATPRFGAANLIGLARWFAIDFLRGSGLLSGGFLSGGHRRGGFLLLCAHFILKAFQPFRGNVERFMFCFTECFVFVLNLFTNGFRFLRNPLVFCTEAPGV